MNIIRKARGEEFSKQAQRIFFCCVKEDVIGRESIIENDLLSMDATVQSRRLKCSILDAVFNQ